MEIMTKKGQSIIQAKVSKMIYIYIFLSEPKRGVTSRVATFH